MNLDIAALKTIKRPDLLQMYYYLRLTRTLEDRITALYRQGRIVGGVYTSNGMEAISVAYASVLERDDIIAPFHRDMGAFLVISSAASSGSSVISPIICRWPPAWHWPLDCAANRAWW